jgi:hypothetical protein
VGDACAVDEAGGPVNDWNEGHMDMGFVWDRRRVVISGLEGAKLGRGRGGVGSTTGRTGAGKLPRNME